MCGIAGFYSCRADNNKQEDFHVAQNMAQSFIHRGPDRGDIWQDVNSPLTFIHRRLAIIDLSDDGAQPMLSPSGRYIVTFNGEIYNYREIRQELENYNVQFRGNSDTEVMLAGFDQWGIEKTISKLNGMFAFALYDQKQKQIHFVRDRFGKKPLYVGWVGNSLFFSSELKACHQHPDFEKNINQDALAIYMKYGYVHAPYSIFENIWQLLPASMLTLSLDGLDTNINLASKMRIYWSLKDVAEQGKSNINQKSSNQIIYEFEGKLEGAVSQRMLSDVPLGAFLSGGIDSSVVVALMQKQSLEPIKTFSAGFEQEGFNEADHAKKVAQHLGTDHHEFYMSDQDALDVIPNLPQIYDEPFADQSQIPTYLISKLAREHATVVLTGDGGDEILAGYDRHTKIPPLWNKVKSMPNGLRRSLCSAMNMLPQEFYASLKKDNPHFGVQVKRTLNLLGLHNADEIYDALVSGWQDGDKAVLNGAMPEIPLRDQSQWPYDIDFLDQMIFGDILSYRPNDLMVKTDRASMAASIEARAPLMDYKLAEYAFSLPDEMKISNGQGKWILRQILKKHIPEHFYERPKMGFSVPLNQWLRGPLNDWAQDLLDENRLQDQGLLDVSMVRAQWNNFQNNLGFQPPRKDLWLILMFQAWHKEWME